MEQNDVTFHEMWFGSCNDGKLKYIFFLFFLWIFYCINGIISTLRIVENSEEKAIKDHMFNSFLARYFNVNYLDFLFLSFLEKKEVQTSFLLTMPRNASSALSTWGV